MKLQWLLFFIVVCFVECSGAFQCLIISGVQHDEDGAFDHDHLVHFKKPTVAGSPCLTFDSIQKLMDYAYPKSGVSPFKKEERILFYLGAHGDPKSGAICNSVTEKWQDVLALSEKLAEDHPVAAVIDSCFSGELLRQKLVHDAKAQDLSSIEKLCLVTSSVPGHFAQAPAGPFSRPKDFSDLLTRAKSSQSMEEIFEQTRTEFRGTISSAVWDSIGASEWLLHRDTVKATNVLKKMNTVCQLCSVKADQAASKACANPSVDTKIWDILTKKQKDFGKKSKERTEAMAISQNESLPPTSDDEKSLILERLLLSDSPELMGEDYEECGEFSSLRVLNAFQEGSFKLLDSELGSPMDLKRRKACRNFKFSDAK